MNVGKTIFAQLMEFVPWTSVTRIVDRYGRNAGIRRLSFAEQFRAMAFAQLTSRESLKWSPIFRHRFKLLSKENNGMATGKQKVHSPDFKAQVAPEAVKGVATVNEIAYRFDVYPMMVRQ